MAATPPICDFGIPAPEFELKGVDGKTHDLASLKGAKGTVIVFMCNHCPYVKSILDRLVRDAEDLAEIGVNMVGICANDAETYPEDSFDRMKELSESKQFPFIYLHDESQTVAQAYGAVCTPDFFGYDGDLKLQYRGRLDASRTTLVPNARRDLYEAMKQVAETGHGPEEQIASMGCSIKWKTA